MPRKRDDVTMNILSDWRLSSAGWIVSLELMRPRFMFTNPRGRAERGSRGVAVTLAYIMSCVIRGGAPSGIIQYCSVQGSAQHGG